MNYITKYNKEIKINITDNNKSSSFKLNLPDNKSSYLTGNGEGVWACCSKEDYDTMESKTPTIFVAKILNDSIYYPELKCDSYVLAEYRGEDCRPIAILDELQNKYKFSQESKDKAFEEIFKLNNYLCYKCSKSMNK